MIHVRKSKKKQPQALIYNNYRDHLNQIYNNGIPNKEIIDPAIYRAEDVIKKLASLYNEKCAYCETKEPDFEVEHYRPKKQIAVKDRNGEDHSGYYWLSYEWTNLFPACHDCNKNGVKGNRFPIAGIRATVPLLPNGTINENEMDFESDSLLTKEKPLLLHPEDPKFDPFYYFKFDNKGKIMEVGRGDSDRFKRANATIEIVDLNREKLQIHRRKKEIKDLQYQIKGFYLNYLRDRYELDENRASERLKRDFFRVLNIIKRKANPKEEYSFFWNYLFLNIGIVLQTCLKPKYRTIFLELTNLYKEENP